MIFVIKKACNDIFWTNFAKYKEDYLKSFVAYTLVNTQSMTIIVVHFRNGINGPFKIRTAPNIRPFYKALKVLQRSRVLNWVHSWNLHESLFTLRFFSLSLFLKCNREDRSKHFSVSILLCILLTGQNV